MPCGPMGKATSRETHVAWTLTRGAPYTPSPILVGDDAVRRQRHRRADGGRRRAPACVRYQQRLGGNYSASPVLADGRIYFQSEEGVTTVMAPGRHVHRLAVNRLDGATAGVDGDVRRAIYIRSDQHLYRIGS